MTSSTNIPCHSWEGATTFSDISTFVSSSTAQPALYLETLGIFSSCTEIAWRWVSINGTGNEQELVRGIDVFEVDSQGQVSATYAEFNSGAWLLDLGLPECSTSTTATTTTTSTPSSTSTTATATTS
jgi:hypothetical protein